MSRADLVIVAAPGAYGKPRSAVIVQSNAIPQGHASVVIHPITAELGEADFRITIELGPDAGLGPVPGDADRPVTILRERTEGRIGHPTTAGTTRLTVAFISVMGLAD